MYLLTHSLVLVLVAVMKPKVLKTKISHADPPTLSLLFVHCAFSLSLSAFCSPAHTHRQHTRCCTHVALRTPYLPCWHQPGRPPAARPPLAPQLSLQLPDAGVGCHPAPEQTKANVTTKHTYANRHIYLSRHAQDSRYKSYTSIHVGVCVHIHTYTGTYTLCHTHFTCICTHASEHNLYVYIYTYICVYVYIGRGCSMCARCSCVYIGM